jgi:hypothetical protein
MAYQAIHRNIMKCNIVVAKYKRGQIEIIKRRKYHQMKYVAASAYQRKRGAWRRCSIHEKLRQRENNENGISAAARNGCASAAAPSKKCDGMAWRK